MQEQELAKMVLKFEANVTELEKQLSRVLADGEKTAKGIENQFTKLKGNFDNSLMKMKINEVRDLQKKLQAELEKKLALNADAASIERTKLKLNSVNGILDGLQTKSRETKGTLAGMFEGGINKAVIFWGKLAAIGIAAKAIFGYAIESAKVENLKKAFDKIASGAGADPVKLLNDLQKATAGAVKEFDLLKTVNRGSFLGVDIMAMPTLLRFATIRAQETGDSIDYLTDSIITGLGRKSPLILDNLGLTMKELDRAVIQVAASHGVVLTQVDELARAEYLTAAAVIVAQKAIDKSVVSIDSLNTDSQRLSKNWNDLTTRLGKAFTPIIATAVSWLDKLTKAVFEAGQATGRFFRGTPKLELELTYKQPKVQPYLTYKQEKDSPLSPLDPEKEKAKAQKIADDKKAAEKALYDSITFLSDSYRLYREKMINEEVAKMKAAHLSEVDIKKFTIAQKKKMDEDYVNFLKNKMRDVTGGSDVYTFSPNGELQNMTSTFGAGGNRTAPMQPVPMPEKPGFAGVGSEADIIDEWISQSETAKVAYNDLFDIMASGFDMVSVKAATNANATTRFWVNAANIIIQSIEQLLIKMALIKIFGFVATGGSSAVVDVGSTMAHTGGTFTAGANGRAMKMAGGGEFTVPKDFYADSFGPVFFETGEKVKVTPANQVSAQDRTMSAMLKRLDIMNLTLIESSVRQTKGSLDVNVTGETGNDAIYWANKKESKHKGAFN